MEFSSCLRMESFPPFSANPQAIFLRSTSGVKELRVLVEEGGHISTKCVSTCRTKADDRIIPHHPQFLADILYQQIDGSVCMILEVVINYQIHKMNRSSLADKLKNIAKCDICFEQYNRREKQPVIICTMHHTVCRECVKDLEGTRKCPFCREPINFSKVVVNNYIFQLLPNEPNQNNNPIPPPNTRVQLQQPMPPPLNHPPIANNNFPPTTSVNYQPQQPVYPPNYFPPPSQQHRYYVPPEPFEMDNIQEQPFDCEDCWSSIQSRLRLNYQKDRKGIYVSIFILQLPYLFFDFLFALTKGDPACMDTPYVTKAYVVRPWLLAMGITEATIMGILLIGALLRVCNIIEYSCLKIFQYIAVGILVLKILLWMYMEIALFQAVISPHCHGGIYAYGLIQFIIHGLFILLICVLASCK